MSRATTLGFTVNEFVKRFADWWEAPDPDRLDTILAEDVVLIQPLAPATRGLAEGKAGFRDLLSFLPDLTATVHTWAVEGEHVFIHFTLSATYGGKPIEWDAVDRFVVREDGLSSERVSWFDSGPLGLQMLLNPRGWPQLARSSFRPRLRARPRGRAAS